MHTNYIFYSESMARCVEDYKTYQNLWSCFYPQRLLFKGHRLKVSKAPEPDEIVWENIEVPRSVRFLSRSRINVFTLILILVGFIIVLQANIYKQFFDNQKPNLSLCSKEIPALFSGTYTTNSIINSYQFSRPDESTALVQDSLCKVGSI